VSSGRQGRVASGRRRRRAGSDGGCAGRAARAARTGRAARAGGKDGRAGGARGRARGRAVGRGRQQERRGVRAGKTGHFLALWRVAWTCTQRSMPISLGKIQSRRTWRDGGVEVKSAFDLYDWAGERVPCGFADSVATSAPTSTVSSSLSPRGDAQSRERRSVITLGGAPAHEPRRAAHRARRHELSLARAHVRPGAS